MFSRILKPKLPSWFVDRSLYPNEEYDKEAVRRCLEYALEVRRRVKEQLKKIGGMEFFDVHFSYITCTLSNCTTPGRPTP